MVRRQRRAGRRAGGRTADSRGCLLGPHRPGASAVTLVFTPRPGSAPLTSMVAAQARMEARLLLRNGEQLLLALVIPVLVLVGLQQADGLLDLGPGRRIDVLTPGVLALVVLSTGFTSVAISTGFERRHGLLKRLGATPLPRSALLAGKVGAVLIVEAFQLTLISAIALGLGWQPRGGVQALLSVVGLVLAGTAAFVGLALLMAGTLRADTTLAAANLVYLLLLAGGGVIVPFDRYPASVQPVMELLPTGALAEGLRDVLDGAAVGLGHVAILLAWTVVAATLAARTFRWE
ncbi:MAG: ABC transporter permease [Nocardioidaceae bacterium]|nr:ABC transporter permease [Nocardioidaceae bacterium]